MINGIKIYGTPWCKQCGPWAFMANHAELAKKNMKKIPKRFRYIDNSRSI